jgi:chaperonin GroES
MNMIKPLGDRIVVERMEAEEKTAGGIIIPDNAKEKPVKGKVLAVGDGAKDENGKRIPMDVKVGDCVMFAKWSGTEIKIEGKEVLIMKESDVLGIVSGDCSMSAKSSSCCG